MAEDHKVESRNDNKGNVNMIEYSSSRSNQDTDNEAIRVIIQRIHNEFGDVFKGLDVLKAPSS